MTIPPPRPRSPRREAGLNEIRRSCRRAFAPSLVRLEDRRLLVTRKRCQEPIVFFWIKVPDTSSSLDDNLEGVPVGRRSSQLVRGRPEVLSERYQAFP